MLPDLDVDARHASLRDALGQVVAQQAASVRGYELLSSAEVRAVLDQEANKQMAGCSATSCLAELAEALDADLVVSGRIASTAEAGGGEATLVSLSLVNARAIVVVNRVNVVWRGPAAQLPDVVRTSAQRLLVDAEDRAPGSIILTGVPGGARVVVDGVERTSDHERGGVRGLDVGVHEIAVDAVDKLPLTTWAIVESGKDVTVDASLESVPVPSVWLLTGGVAAVVAGAALTGAAVYFSGKGDVTVTATTPDLDDVETFRGAHK